MAPEPAGGGPARPPGGGSWSRSWILLAVLLAAAVWVLWRLPTEVPSPEVQAPPPSPEEPATASTPIDAERILDARREAEALAKTLTARLAELDGRGIGHWDAGARERLAKAGESADRAFEDRRYAEARETRAEAVQAARRLLAESGDVLARSLAEGQEALARGDSGRAREAFTLALAVEPEHPEAVRGLRRSETLDEVRELVRDGTARERAGELEEARERFERALEIDPEAASAKEGVARVDEALTERAFRRAMSRGLEALERGEAGTARDAFREAATLRPGRPEVADGLARASVLLQERAIRLLRDEAAELEAQERWSEALATYRKILETDPTLAFAREGRDRAARRARIAKELGDTIASPDRLTSRAVQAETEDLLAEARAVEGAGPGLREQIERAEHLLEAARTPAVVELRSDDLTDVVLYKKGRLGQFDTRELRLPPGRYTLVGKRDGFRDVRVELRVPFGETRVGPISIRCEDRI